MIFTFAATLGNFIDDDWNLVERLVDFYHLEDDEHKGQQAAKAFVRSTAGRGALDKISPSSYHCATFVAMGSKQSICLYFISLTMDNASPNDVLARTLRVLLLKRYGIHFTPENGQIRCLAHVVNLIVQKILHELFEADDPALQDYYELFNKH